MIGGYCGEQIKKTDSRFTVGNSNSGAVLEIKILQLFRRGVQFGTKKTHKIHPALLLERKLRMVRRL